MTYGGGEVYLVGENSPCACVCVGGGVGVLFEMCLFEGPSECCRGFVGCAILSFNGGRVCGG